jgi:hypothetical protein
MRLSLLAALAAAWIAAGPAAAAEWRVQRIDTPARVSALETVGGQVRIQAGGLWYAITHGNGRPKLEFIEGIVHPRLPPGALPDGRVATGSRNIARAWFAQPTSRYNHGVLGDAVEAGRLVIETRDGKQHSVQLGNDAVFEDLSPRIADVDGDGRDEVVVVKSYLKRGSALAIVADVRGRYRVVAETPALGRPHRWLDPAGIADFTGDGQASVALVRQPHVIGQLELWRWQDGRLQKIAEIEGFANHIIGTRAIAMSAVADFNGDGIADLALPSFDRSRLRIISFTPEGGPREITSVVLPAKVVTNFALLTGGDGKPLIALALADGSLVIAGE